MMIIEGKDTEDENGFGVRDIGCNVSGLGYVLSVNDVCIQGKRNGKLEFPLIETKEQGHRKISSRDYKLQGKSGGVSDSDALSFSLNYTIIADIPTWTLITSF